MFSRNLKVWRLKYYEESDHRQNTLLFDGCIVSRRHDFDSSNYDFFPSRCGLRLFSRIFPFVNSKFSLAQTNRKSQIGNRKFPAFFKFFSNFILILFHKKMAVKAATKQTDNFFTIRIFLSQSTARLTFRKLFPHPEFYNLPPSARSLPFPKPRLKRRKRALPE